MEVGPATGGAATVSAVLQLLSCGSGWRHQFSWGSDDSQGNYDGNYDGASWHSLQMITNFDWWEGQHLIHPRHGWPAWFQMMNLTCNVAMRHGYTVVRGQVVVDWWAQGGRRGRVMHRRMQKQKQHKLSDGMEETVGERLT